MMGVDCEECGRRFLTAEARNGHQSKHAEVRAIDVEQ